MIRTDEELKKSIVDHLFWNDSIDSSSIKVDVTGGKAVLSGSVLTYSAKDAASADAWLVNGVRAVENHLKVQFPSDFPTLTDDQKQSHASNVLAWNGDIHNLTISVSVTGGVVTLEGTIPSYWQRTKAETIISDLLGVVNVVPKLIVIPTEYLTDQAIMANIKTAIANRTVLQDQDIQVSAENGTVILRGTASTQHDRKNVYTAVANCRGINNIINEIETQS